MVPIHRKDPFRLRLCFKPLEELPRRDREIQKDFDTAHARRVPANGARIGSIEIGGPYAVGKRPLEESLKKVFVCGHLSGHHKPGCARAISRALPTVLIGVQLPRKR